MKRSEKFGECSDMSLSGSTSDARLLSLPLSLGRLKNSSGDNITNDNQ